MHAQEPRSSGAPGLDSYRVQQARLGHQATLGLRNNRGTPVLSFCFGYFISIAYLGEYEIAFGSPRLL